MKSPYEDISPPEPDAEDEVIEPKEDPQKNKMVWISIIVMLALCSAAYRFIVYNHYEQTALMFIGLPTFLAICLTFSDKSKSTTGMICKGITMFLLLLAILAIEGAICILIASPLFYLVGAIIGGITDWAKSSDKKNKGPYAVTATLLIILSLEGTHESLSFEREERVSISREIDLDLTNTRSKLANGPDFNLKDLPLFLKLGFPMPEKIEGQGVHLGSQWQIHFAGGEGSPGDLIVEVTESTPERITFTNLSDTSHIAHWLHWRTITWELSKTSEGTIVQMHLAYRRDLDPAWYFKPIERYGVKKAGEYFLDQTFKQNSL